MNPPSAWIFFIRFVFRTLSLFADGSRAVYSLTSYPESFIILCVFLWLFELVFSSSDVDDEFFFIVTSWYMFMLVCVCEYANKFFNCSFAHGWLLFTPASGPALCLLKCDARFVDVVIKLLYVFEGPANFESFCDKFDPTKLLFLCIFIESLFGLVIGIMRFLFMFSAVMAR